MKKLICIFSISIMVYACGNQDGSAAANGDSASAGTAHEEPAVKDPTQNPDYEKGLSLIATSDCLTCHKVDEKAVGPAYREVANKYTADDATIEMLADKVISGGAGVWGQIPMSPHPALSKDDAKQMVKYILLLKNN